MRIGEKIITAILELMERRLRESGITDSGVQGSYITGPLDPGLVLYEHAIWDDVHTDVDTGDTRASGDVLTWNGTSWVATAPLGNHNLWSTTHADVNTADTRNNGDVLTWDSVSSKWLASPPLGNHDLWSSSHPDIDTADTRNDADVLTWDSGASKWKASPIPAGFTSPMTALGDIIKGGTAGVAERLGIGTEGYILSVAGGAPAWIANPATSVVWTPLTDGLGGFVFDDFNDCIMVGVPA